MLSEPPASSNSFELSASYVVYRRGNLTVVQNCTSGGAEHSSEDSAAAIQWAIDQSRHGGVIVIREGSYLLNRSLVVHEPVTIAGSGTGHYNGSVSYGTVLEFEQLQDGVVISSENGSYTGGLVIRDLTLDGGQRCMIGLNLVKAAKCSFDNLLVVGFTHYGTWLQEAHMNNFENCRFMENGIGSPLTGGVLVGYNLSANANTFWGCTFEFGGSGAVIVNSYATSFNGCVFEGNHFHGVYGTSSADRSAYAQHISINDCYFELNNIARSNGTVCDILVEGSGSSYWSVENVKTSGWLVNYSVVVEGWFTHLSNVRAMDRTILWKSPQGSMEFVENLDPASIPIAPDVQWSGPRLAVQRAACA